jgi:hypothetical protein
MAIRAVAVLVEDHDSLLIINASNRHSHEAAVLNPYH